MIEQRQRKSPSFCTQMVNFHRLGHICLCLCVSLCVYMCMCICGCMCVRMYKSQWNAVVFMRACVHLLLMQQDESDIHLDVLTAMTSLAKLKEHIENIKTHTLPVRYILYPAAYHMVVIFEREKFHISSRRTLT